VNVNKDFQAVADFFTSVRYLPIVPQLVREPDRSVGRRNDPCGGDFLEQIARPPEKTQITRLHRILEARRVAVPQLKELELWSDVRGTPRLRGKYEHWRPLTYYKMKASVWTRYDSYSRGRTVFSSARIASSPHTFQITRGPGGDVKVYDL
jgi:hypothetical protein